MIHVFIGTKAQYIKMAPLLRRMDAEQVDYRLIDSGQHGGLTAALRAELGVREPDFRLGRNRDVVSVPQAVGWALGLAGHLASRSRLRNRVFGGHGGVCVVHGDTPSTLMSALLAKRAGMAVAHVEAGLRTFRWLHPFPEEIVRVLVGRIADVLFAPGPEAASNLRDAAVRAAWWSSRRTPCSKRCVTPWEPTGRHSGGWVVGVTPMLEATPRGGWW